MSSCTSVDITVKSRASSVPAPHQFTVELKMAPGCVGGHFQCAASVLVFDVERIRVGGGTLSTTHTRQPSKAFIPVLTT